MVLCYPKLKIFVSCNEDVWSGDLQTYTCKERVNHDDLDVSWLRRPYSKHSVLSPMSMLTKSDLRPEVPTGLRPEVPAE